MPRLAAARAIGVPRSVRARSTNSAWYLHRTPEYRYYFDRQENLTKLLENLARDSAGQHTSTISSGSRLSEMFKPDTQERLPRSPGAAATRRPSRTGATCAGARHREPGLEDPTRRK